MSRDLNDLTPEFKGKVEELIVNCAKRGVTMRPFFTKRTPLEQAKLWRQSRSTGVILKKVAELRKQDAYYIADCIMKAGSQSGRWATNAYSGMSWHQWGLAVDCFWLVNDNDEWSTTKIINGVNGYQVYAEEARKLGLKAGADFGDAVHVQFPQESSPIHKYSLKEINDKMQEMFG